MAKNPKNQNSVSAKEFRKMAMDRGYILLNPTLRKIYPTAGAVEAVLQKSIDVASARQRKGKY